MLSKDFLEALSQRAAGLFPAAADLRQDLEKQLYELLQDSFARLNLVTREEFDAQQAVLRQAEETIVRLEQQILKLEQQVADAGAPQE